MSGRYVSQSDWCWEWIEIFQFRFRFRFQTFSAVVSRRVAASATTFSATAGVLSEVEIKSAIIDCLPTFLSLLGIPHQQRLRINAENKTKKMFQVLIDKIGRWRHPLLNSSRF